MVEGVRIVQLFQAELGPAQNLRVPGRWSASTPWTGAAPTLNMTAQRSTAQCFKTPHVPHMPHVPQVPQVPHSAVCGTSKDLLCGCGTWHGHRPELQLLDMHTFQTTVETRPGGRGVNACSMQ